LIAIRPFFASVLLTLPAGAEQSAIRRPTIPHRHEVAHRYSGGLRVELLLGSP